jgi:hypothetical protein
MPIGTELTFDYQWGHHSARQKTVCLCGTDSCRGFIEVDDWVDEVSHSFNGIYFVIYIYIYV